MRCSGSGARPLVQTAALRLDGHDAAARAMPRLSERYRREQVMLQTATVSVRVVTPPNLALPVIMITDEQAALLLLYFCNELNGDDPLTNIIFTSSARPTEHRGLTETKDYQAPYTYVLVVV